MDGVDPTNLVAVAAAVSAQPMGDDLLRQTILEVADLCGAEVNYAHEVAALLLCEGVATVIETNYDDCIERAALPERLVVVRTPHEMLDAPSTALLKAHGCATAPRTMIITQAELDAVPRWAEIRVASELRSSRVAFVGIGSPADYVRESIRELAVEVGFDHLVFVDPSLAGWDSNTPPEWRSVLPELDPDNRDARTAEEFLDGLLRAYLDHPRRIAREKVGSMVDDHPQRRGLENLLVALEARNAVWAMRWMRAASNVRPGQAVARSQTLIKGLLALGCLLGNSPTPRLATNGWVIVSGEGATDGSSSAPLSGPEPRQPAVTESMPVMLLMVHGAVLGSAAEAMARRRVLRARADDIVPAGADVVIVVVGHIGPMSGEVSVERGDRLDALLAGLRSPEDNPPENLVSAGRPNHLIDGVSSGSVFLVNGDLLIEAA